jgi:hypothetical protein
LKLIALCSWYDERPEHLRQLVRSLAPVVDLALFLDGPYELYGEPGTPLRSPAEQAKAIRDEAQTCGLRLVLVVDATPRDGWPRPGEVGKRRELWRRGLELARPGDWLFWVDADEVVERAETEQLRRLLARTERDVAEVTMAQRLDVESSWPMRRLFRALPDLTCDAAHWHVVADARVLQGNSDLHALEPAEDATALLTIRHRREERCSERNAAQRRFYELRDATGDEKLTA